MPKPVEITRRQTGARRNSGDSITFGGHILRRYDELKEQVIFKNLYRANNLEQYRCEADQIEGERLAREGAKPEDIAKYFLQPKCIVTTRSELLARNPNYVDSFLPLETNNNCKDEPHEALAYFDEMRLAPFDDKLSEYIGALVALHTRADVL